MRDFSHLNTGKFSRLKILGIVTLFSMLVGGGIAFFIFYFSVQNIEIQRDELDLNLRHGELLQMMESVKRRNLLILPIDFLKKQIKIRFPELDSLSIYKKYPKTLIIKAKTEPVVFRLVYSVIGEKDDFFGYITKNGIFFYNGKENIFTIFEKDPRKHFINPLEKVFLPSEIEEILRGKELLEKIISRKIISAELLRNAQEIHFVDQQNVKYWLFLGKDLNVQIQKLVTVLKEKNIYEKPLLYVDLRIGRKVIYKNK